MLKHITQVNRYRTGLTEMAVENKVVGVACMVAAIFFCTSIFLITLARVAEQHRPSIACAPAAALVPATRPTKPPYEPAYCRPASEQAGELAAFYRNNF